MALQAKHKETIFGVGDTVRVHQKTKEGEKERTQAFEGIVIAIKGRGAGKTFTVRKIGVQQIGIERIFPLGSPSIEEITVSKSGSKGVKRAKLYYIREKSRKEIDKIYVRAQIKEESKKKKKPSNIRKTKSSKKK